MLSNGILFNHESPIRGETFVTRGDAQRRPHRTGLEECFISETWMPGANWGHAKGDYVEGMHKILQADKPTISCWRPGETRSVREFVEIAFAEVGR